MPNYKVGQVYDEQGAAASLVAPCPTVAPVPTSQTCIEHAWAQMGLRRGTWGAHLHSSVWMLDMCMCTPVHVPYAMHSMCSMQRACRSQQNDQRGGGSFGSGGRPELRPEHHHSRLCQMMMLSSPRPELSVDCQLRLDQGSRSPPMTRLRVVSK